jgi:hypothetical protein
VAIAEAVEGLAAVPVGVTAGGHHPTRGVPHPTWRGPLWRTHARPLSGKKKLEIEHEDNKNKANAAYHVKM